ncbi:MAG: hypothetical protein RBU21_09300 [FCB group bacterium]|nr:hypothetical protein [FCB group bacterium]
MTPKERLARLEFQMHHILAALEDAEQTAIDALAGRLDGLKRISQHMERRDEFKALRCGAQAIAATPRPNHPSAHSQSSSQRCNRLRL